MVKKILNIKLRKKINFLIATNTKDNKEHTNDGTNFNNRE